MTLSTMIDRLALEVQSPDGTEGYRPSGLPGLGFIQYSTPTSVEATVYEPVVCLILRGRKRTAAGSMAVEFGRGESLIVSHHLPVVTQVTECPYLALVLAIDVDILRSLVVEVDEGAGAGTPATTLGVARTEELLVEALGRYAALAHTPTEARVLAPLVLKEIHFRLLMASHGGMLRKLLQTDSNASHIHRAVRGIRENFRLPLLIGELARSVGMSESAFHRHFKSITGTTPLQYQKRMRLLEARRLLSTQAYPVSRAAFEVGYASPTQFSREYSREFGAAPREHGRGR